MVISVLLLISVCARSDYRPDPWETSLRPEAVWFPVLLCVCRGVAVPSCASAVSFYLFSTHRHCVEASCERTHQTASLFGLDKRSTLQAQIGCQEQISPSPTQQYTHASLSVPYNTTLSMLRLLFNLYNSAEKSMLTLCCVTGRMSELLFSMQWNWKVIYTTRHQKRLESTIKV